MYNFRQMFLATVMVSAMFIQKACTANQYTTALGIAQIATANVVAILSIAGKIPPADVPEVTKWANDAEAGFSLSATELASSDTSAQKSLKIASYFAATLSDISSMPPDALPYITLAQSDIQAFLNMVTPPAGAAGANFKLPEIEITMTDKQKLGKIKADADADRLKLASLQGFK